MQSKRAGTGVVGPPQEAKALFDHYDDDGGGTISFPEFSKGVNRYVKPDRKPN